MIVQVNVMEETDLLLKTLDAANVKLLMNSKSNVHPVVELMKFK